MVHNFVNIGRFLTNWVPIDSPERSLSIGINFDEIRSILNKLWTKIGIKFDEVRSVLTKLWTQMCPKSDSKRFSEVSEPPFQSKVNEKSKLLLKMSDMDMVFITKTRRSKQSLSQTPNPFPILLIAEGYILNAFNCSLF